MDAIWDLIETNNTLKTSCPLCGKESKRDAGVCDRHLQALRAQPRPEPQAQPDVIRVGLPLNNTSFPG